MLNSSKIEVGSPDLMSQSKRKRNSCDSPSLVGKQKKVKQKIIKTCKRPKNFNSVLNVKRRKCSVSSVDSFMSAWTRIKLVCLSVYKK